LRVLDDARNHWTSLGETKTPLLFLPLASQNLFRGEAISISFGSWADKRLFGDGEQVASIDVEGGRALSPVDSATIQTRAFRALAGRGMPYPYFALPSGFDPTVWERTMAQLSRVRGHFRLVARSEGDIYPHSGQFALAVTLEPRT
jgi:hypothetical protein